MVRTAIEVHFPHHGIVGEEGGRQANDAEYVWVVDPLDGTHNYIRGIPLYGVSIGVMRKGCHVVGVVYMPETDCMYAAERGAGAFRNGRRIHVSSTKELARCSMSFDSGIRRAPRRTLDALARLAPRVFNIRMFGASTVLLTYLAEGRIDFAVEFDDQPWDFAAGVCMIREAGGVVTTPTGETPAMDSCGYIASNGHVHDQIAAILAGGDEERRNR
ncbi:MAG: inositol monophosphatase [Chitinivibrionales bacterium]|nr:inositol monophosphatase [Chitinivibrionales bacterium]MBD3357832.1 inositol monophosphatase [Chitinivibrionales bacterium]